MFAPSESANVNGTKSGLKICFLLLMGLCFAGTLLLMALSAGIMATPLDTTDSEGRKMGLVDPFSPEHYRIALGNFRPANLLVSFFAHDWLLLLAIVIGAACLGSNTRSVTRATRWYFLCQSALFFPGFLSVVFLIWPYEVLQLIRLRSDRETFDEFSMGCILAQAPWVVLSWLVLWAFPGEPLGLKQAWAKIRRWMAHRNLIATD